ncbi:MAG: hypothetical protein AAFZ67_11620 [Planctomycetota bacterium]
MATDLCVDGPYEIEYESNGAVKRVRPSDGIDFWAYDVVAHLRKKQGCYVFAIRAGKGFKPWYVGQASKGFEQETFTYHKREHYNSALFRGTRGTPVLFFVTPPDNKRKVAQKELTHMEKELIQYALAKNPDLCNVQHTRNVPQWSIRGVIRSGQGKPTTAAKQFRLMMKM